MERFPSPFVGYRSGYSALGSGLVPSLLPISQAAGRVESATSHEKGVTTAPELCTAAERDGGGAAARQHRLAGAKL